MRTNFDQLLEAGAHFGHLKRKWNPAMAPYIYMERNGIHIIDLNKTAIKVEEAAEALKNLARSGRKVLFVGTKKQAQEVVATRAQEVGMPYITERWAGGILIAAELRNQNTPTRADVPMIRRPPMMSQSWSL